ncbi:hypothetical protein BGW38_002889 [Lunasporangiospora selenospora]|uniref:Uncharacterized protein n=1 Tax=Lunasporangiospora selenospora TaxID=979761 RepID=A0A9P6KH41_9FUNG|nr:hypothetical protein BGW38_002889 [Lunasporangiospora selenospora]
MKFTFLAILAVTAIAHTSTLVAAAPKCTWTYKSSETGKAKTLSNPPENECINFNFRSYAINNRCYVGATIYVNKGCNGNSWHIEGGEDYKGRHDIYWSIKFD